jgi:hypothetical protein
VLLKTAVESSISGRVEFEGAPLRQNDPLQLRLVTDDPRAMDSSNGRYSAVIGSASVDRTSETFRMTAPDRPVRIVLGTAPPGWWIKSASIGGVDATMTPVMLGGGDAQDEIRILLADTAGTLTGVVRAEQGQVSDDAVVIVFPRERERWHLVSPRVRIIDTQGQPFSVRLPPGEYLVAAVQPGDDSSVWEMRNTPDWLERFSGVARAVSVPEGRPVTTDLRLVPLPR